MTNEYAAEIIKAYQARLKASCSNLLDRDIEAFDVALRALDRPSGKWVVAGEGTTHYYACSNCGCAGDFSDDYCRHCGSDMR